MPLPTPRSYRAAQLAGVGTDDAPELPAWCAESGCDACRQFDEEPVPGRQPGRRGGRPSPTPSLPRGDRARYP